MKRENLITTLLLPLLLLSLCAMPAEARTKLRTVKTIKVSDGVRQIVNYSPFTVEYNIGKPKVEIQSNGSSDMADHLQVHEDSRCLYFNYRTATDSKSNDNYMAGETLLIKVWSEDINALKNFGIGDIRADKVDGAKITLQTFGTGPLRISNIYCTSLNMDVYGAGAIYVDKVDCASMKILVQGTGNINVKSSDSTSVDVISQGTGKVELSNMDATSVAVLNQGTGDVILTGDVTTAKYNNQGTGDIIATGVKAVRSTKVNTGLGVIRD